MKYISRFGLTLVATLLMGITYVSAQQLSGYNNVPSNQAVTQAGVTNLVLNGSFEDTTSTGSFTHWSDYNDESGAATLTPDTTSSDVLFGKVSLKIVNPQDNPGNQWHIQLVSDGFATTVGNTYRISLWVKSKTNGGVGQLSTNAGNNTSNAQYGPNWTTSTNWRHVVWYIDANTAQTNLALNMGAKANTYYIDGITVADSAAVANMAKPTNLMVQSHGTHTDSLTWTAPSGIKTPTYAIYRSTQSNNVFSDSTMIGMTMNTHFKENNLISDTTYYYAVTAIDTANIQSGASQVVNVKTDAFASYKTWDFENGLGSWAAGQGDNMTVATVDSLSYSGSHSAVLVPTGSGNLDFENDNSGVLGGQLIRYEIWVPQVDSAAINGIQTFYQHTSGWTWESHWYNGTSIKYNAWNMLTVRVADTVKSLDRIGIQFTAQSGASLTAPVFVDFVTTNPKASRMVTAIPKQLNANIPDKVVLGNNYPNPFNPTTNITYKLPMAANVKLSVYNILGQKVATLVKAHQTAGSYMVSFAAASRLASGVYFYRLQANNIVKVKKMLLLK